VTALFTLCDRVAAFFGYLPADRLNRARATRAVALRQAQEQRERRIASDIRASELELVMAQLEAEVRELRRTADKVRQ